LSPSERKEVLRLFEYYVVATYSDRLSEYVGGGVAARVIGSRLDPDGTIVSSEFNRGSGPSTAGAIIFKLHCGKLTLKIYTKGERVLHQRRTRAKRSAEWEVAVERPTYDLTLRIEVVAHNTRELNCGRSLDKFPEVVSRLKSVLERVCRCPELHRSVLHRR
jgi:hypothetical protein